jgi:hypothetical protein
MFGKRNLRFERLEDRRLLAGNVSVSLTGNVLNITGDAASNAIAITSTADGAVTVTGLATSGGATTINTKPGAPANQTFYTSYAGYVGNIIVNMSGSGTASDIVVIAGLSFNGSISVRMSGGNDFVGLGDFDNSAQLVDPAVNSMLVPLIVHQGISIDMGAGDNHLMAHDVVTNGAAGANFSIVAAAGANSISLSNVAVDHGFSLTTNGATSVAIDHMTANSSTITLGNGDDQLLFNASVIRGDLTIRTQNGNDQISFDTDTITTLNLSTGAGDDQVSMSNLRVIKLATVDLGAGNDTATFDLDTFQGLNLLGGAGNDTFSFAAAQPPIQNDFVSAGALTINGGAGDDSMTLNNVSAYVFNISGGDGADQISATYMTVGFSATIAGGAGNDVVSIDGLRTGGTRAQMIIGLGLGDDHLTMRNVEISSLEIGGGDGNDTISLGRPASDSDIASGLSVNLQELAVALGNGNDQLFIQNTSVNTSTVLGGGAGSDTYTDLGGNALAGLIHKNIEIDLPDSG